MAHVVTWIIAALRARQFATLAELKSAISGQLEAYNAEPFQKRTGSRASVVTSEEKELLRPLPATGYEISR